VVAPWRSLARVASDVGVLFHEVLAQGEDEHGQRKEERAER